MEHGNVIGLGEGADRLSEPIANLLEDGRGGDRVDGVANLRNEKLHHGH
jgi:hypothetical protein